MEGRLCQAGTVSRPQVVKKLWAYLKEKNLQVRI